MDGYYCVERSGVDNVEVEISCAGERARKRIRKEESKERFQKKECKNKAEEEKKKEKRGS
jgi:hypothetical protein